MKEFIIAMLNTLYKGCRLYGHDFMSHQLESMVSHQYEVSHDQFCSTPNKLVYTFTPKNSTDSVIKVAFTMSISSPDNHPGLTSVVRFIDVTEVTDTAK